MMSGILMPENFKEYVKEIYTESNAAGAYAAFPVKTKKVEIFKSKPPACADTFMKSMYLQPQTNYIDTVVLYSADMNLLQILDNSESAATTTYQKSISKGFTFTVSEAISAGVEFEASFIVATSKISIQVTISFSESWTTTVTETHTCTVGPHEKAFFYQGTVKAAIMRYDTEHMKFRYLGNQNTGKYETNIIKTTSVPIV